MTIKLGMGRSSALDVMRRMKLDTISIGRDRLNIAVKDRANLFPWNGQFSPQLIEAILRTYARPDDLVLDPFLGSGTVLCEAGRLGLPCFGVEINPAAFKMARTYRFLNASPDEREGAFDEIGASLQDVIPDSLPIFRGAAPEVGSAELQRAVVALSSNPSSEWSAILLDALIILLDFYKEDSTATRVFATWEKLKATVAVLPSSRAPVGLANTDARSLPLAPSVVDLVVTSPPYINVFNYHQQYRASAEALGWDLLKVARSEIGSNRKNRGNRFLTVIQYCLDLTGVLLELMRVCKPGARMILVVGRESSVRKTRFFNGEIVAALAARCAGLVPEVRQERVFKNRFGALIYEDILHFRNERSDAELIDPLEIAVAALTAAIEHAPDESKADLMAALGGAANVRPSPIYAPARATPIRTAT